MQVITNIYNIEMESSPIVHILSIRDRVSPAYQNFQLEFKLKFMLILFYHLSRLIPQFPFLTVCFVLIVFLIFQKLMFNISNPKLSVNDRLLKALETRTALNNVPVHKSHPANWSLYVPRVSCLVHKN